jgi:ribosomal protein L25 (general stress protein Ctc)
MTDNTLLTIEGFERTLTGKSANRKLRKAGRLPAVLLDSGKSTLLEINPKLLGKAYKSHDKKFNLEFKGQVKTVRVQELHIDSIKRTPLHIDLMYVK